MIGYAAYLDEIFSQQHEYLGIEKLVNKTVPLLSVHLITYNHAAYIAECLDGILAQQTTFPFEIVVGEDGSLDGTREICMQYAEKYPDKIRLFLRDRNISVLKQDGQTVYFNGKLTLKACRGKYIGICEGDDYWTDPLKLQQQVDFLESNPDYSLTFHNRSVLEFDGSITKKSAGSQPKTIASDHLISTFVPMVSMVFRNYMQEYLKADLKFVFSGDVALRAFLSTKGKAYFMPFYGAVYRRHAGGVKSSKDFVTNRKLWLQSRDEIYKNIKGINKSDLQFSKFVIMNDLFFHYAENKAFLKSVKLLPHMLVSFAQSGRLGAAKLFANTFRSLYLK